MSLVYGNYYYYFIEALLRYLQSRVVEAPQPEPEPVTPEEGARVPAPDLQGMCSAAPGLSSAAWGLLVLLALRRRARTGR